MNDFIDIYCERLETGWMAEPLNVFSNAAFFIIVYFVWLVARREQVINKASLILIGSVIIIGVNSTLFHISAMRWIGIADTLSILFFQIAFLILYARHVMKFSTIGIGLILGLYVSMIVLASQLPYGTVNVPVSYFPALTLIFGLGIWHAHKCLRVRWGFLAAALLFGVSLTFRLLDIPLCDRVPIGLHFIWHILNAGVLYLLLRVYLCNARKYT